MATFHYTAQIKNRRSDKRIKTIRDVAKVYKKKKTGQLEARV